MVGGSFRHTADAERITMGGKNRPTTDTHRSVWSDTGMAIGALRYVTLESGCILCDYIETQDAADMKKIILLAFLLSGCAAVVTKENSASFDTWELCTLLYDPHSLYSNWISDEEENRFIRTELERRGINSKDDCSIESLAQAKCDGLGFKAGTTDYAKCNLDVELHIKEMKQMKKSAQDAEEAAAAIQSQQILNSMQLEQIQQDQQWQEFQQQQQQYFEPVWKP